MTAVGRIIVGAYQLGALGTDSFHFYQRLGWQRWLGPTSVRVIERIVPTPDDDGFVMVLLTDSTRSLDLRGKISCDWQVGNVW